jgi:diguanylate cyclase (GGDEF)-like protein
MLKIAIIGGGHGGHAVLELLGNDPSAEIVGLAEHKDQTSAVKLTKKLNIPHYKNHRELFNKVKDIDIIINVSGNSRLKKDLEKIKPEKAEIIGGTTAKFIWDLIEAKKRVRREIEKRLEEHKAIYEAGIILTQKQNLQEIFTSIVKYAAQLTSSPAGSLAVFDEVSGEMYYGASYGFTKDFTKNMVWKIRPGGMTDYILNQSQPTVISNARKHPKFNNPLMLKEGIRSLVAIPLKADRKIQGILYIDDFRVRHYSKQQLSVLGLLSNMAAFAIERGKLMETTKIQAITDELTKLYNLRHFLSRLTEEIERSNRYKRPISLAMIDVDHFKNYNDTFGHLKGNKVLKKIALLMEKESRDGDIVARYGGEEFAIIMPETDINQAKVFAERVRSKIEKGLSKTEKFGVCVTISIGLAAFPQDADDAAGLIEKADDALYSAKGEGRNCVRITKARVKQLELY